LSRYAKKKKKVSRTSFGQGGGGGGGSLSKMGEKRRGKRVNEELRP